MRTNDDDRYFSDAYQAMPREGYTRMFDRILDHPNIEVSLRTDLADVRDDVEFGHMVYTGPVDAYFGHRFGALPYRSIVFEHKTVLTPGGGLHLPAATVNQPSEDVPYTRTTEYRHMTGQEHDCSTLAIDFPCADGDPYYPVPRPENQALYKRYKELTTELPGVSFVGRLARYQYLNMDQVVGQALSVFERLAARGPVAV